MIITKKFIPRRTFLRGVGTALALPLLDAMVPAATAIRSTAASPKTRLGFFFCPNGMTMDKWTPSAEGAAFEMTPILEPLAPFRDQLLVLSGLDHKTGLAIDGEGGGDHARSSATYLTGVHPLKTEGLDIRVGTSVDQIAARELGKYTQLASLELALETTEVLGACDQGFSCAYSNTLSWRSPTTPVPMENHPRAVFERLFGDSESTDPAQRRARIQEDSSILDWVTQETARLLRELGPGDRSKLTEYLDSVRDIERRIQMAEEQSSQELPSFDRPAGIPATIEEHAKLMFDLQVLAYQSDLTRVTSFMMARAQSPQVYRELGITDGYHVLSHHLNDPVRIAKILKIDIFHTRMFAYFLDRMRMTPDGDGSLLDHSIILYGSGLSDGNLHLHTDLPVLLAGGGTGQIQGGRHIRYPQGTPMTNLYVSMLEKAGVPVQSFGDSTGQLDLPGV
ncbi:MAG: DUF1552 domain-containing protein [Acidobacteriota bacterium]